MAAAEAPPPFPASARRRFRRHFAVFLAVNLVLTAANVVMGAPWWAFWPLAIWSVALLVHYLVYKTSTIDDAWVDARVEDLRSKSYDLSHIDDIKRTPTGAGPERRLDEPR
ncbi:MAG TPA: 2TM domain-containing protein [Burkholderiales bacterium]|nr:2TM domain-containing protein [Burkholderiales bacterium]